MKLTKKNTFFIDLETGGLSSFYEGVCAVSIMRRGETTPETHLIKPKNSKYYSYEALKINGLTAEKLFEEGKLESEVVSLLNKKFAETDTPYIVLIGQYIGGFDIKFLKEISRYLPKPAFYICTKELANRLLKKEGILKNL
ncbi:MAG: hypothetical protein ACOCXG_05940, partial [Nanoarchaeota archaeon]